MTLFWGKKILQRNEEGKKYPAEHLEGKKYPAHQIARKKILDDQKSPTPPHPPPPPPQELNRKHWHALSHSLHFVGHEGESVLGLLQVRLIPHTLL